MPVERKTEDGAITAQEAVRLADNSTYSPNAPATVYKRIRDAAAKGEYEMTINPNLVIGRAELVIKELRRLGFYAEFVTDHRDGDYYLIKWAFGSKDEHL